MVAISALSTDVVTRAVLVVSSQILAKIANLLIGPIPFMCNSGNTVTRIKMTKTIPGKVLKATAPNPFEQPQDEIEELAVKKNKKCDPLDQVQVG
jgi:hypothetical protein